MAQRKRPSSTIEPSSSSSSQTQNKSSHLDQSFTLDAKTVDRSRSRPSLTNSSQDGGSQKNAENDEEQRFGRPESCETSEQPDIQDEHHPPGTSPAQEDGSGDDQEPNASKSIAEPVQTKVIDIAKLRSLDQKVDRSGLIYVSRIPPGMGPGKLKHLLSKWGETNRVYLARDEAAEEAKRKKKKAGKGKKKEIHQSYLFKEGWVEFVDKKVARRVAEMLNTRPIGGKPSDRYYSDLWSLTYLPRFKWSNLSDQIAVERRVREQLQRNSLEDAKRSQDWYLKMVERSRVEGKIREKEIGRKGKIEKPEKWQKNQFRQREMGGPSRSAGVAQNPNENSGAVGDPDGSKLKSVLTNLL